MADNGKSKSMDSDKAALGRKLLNKHQKSKTARSSTNGKQNIDNFEEQAHVNTCLSNYANNFPNAEPTSTISGSVTPELDPKQSESMPIQQYFNMSNNNFFDFDKVTIDDPELKHNEIYNLHHQNISEHSEITAPQYAQQFVGTGEQQLSKEEVESCTNYEESQFCSPPASESPKTTPNVDLMQQLAIDSLQSQLQQQVLTNSHLLGENSQLQGELNHARSTIATHTEEVAQYNVRIELAEGRLTESQRQLENSRRLANDWRVKAEEEEYTVSNVRKERDIALQDASEVLERLGIAQAGDEQTKAVLAQLRAQLDMANIRVQQLMTTTSAASTAPSTRNIGMSETRESLLLVEKQLADVQVALEATRCERDVAAQQYQLYNSQLGEQVVALQTELQALHATTNHLAKRERDLVAHIGDMERLLQNNSSSSAVGGHDSSLTSSKQMVEQVTERLQVACTERDEALRELHKLSGEVEELQELRNSQQVDSLAQAKLLEEIRSDKVAASRAIEQNLVLKAQVTEMEAAYLAITQDKVAPLTDQLATAKHQLHQFERNLRTLHDAVQLKDRELEQMRVCETQVAHLTDRLQHYEAIHDHGAPSIQLQLQNLLHENDRLRKQLEQQQHNHTSRNNDDHEHGDDETLCSHHHDHDHHQHGENDNADNVVVVGGAVDREDELQQEIFQLKQQLDELRRLNAELMSMQQEQEEELHDADDAAPRKTGSDDDYFVTKRLSKAMAAQQLEHKFTRTMDELASLNDEKQRLEHLVLQLQGETETIGEYVALYQRQRSLLAQRSSAREAHLRHLQDRLADLAAALEPSSPAVAAAAADQSSATTVAQLLHEIRKSNADLMLEQQQQPEQQHGAGMEGGASCGVGGCAWCQGKLITV